MSVPNDTSSPAASAQLETPADGRSVDLEFEASLIETVVFRAFRESTDPDVMAQHRGFRERLDDLYELPLDERDEAFRALHLEYFERLGFVAFVRARVHEFPVIVAHAQRVVIVAAKNRKTEGGELFVQHDSAYDTAGSGNNVVLRLLPERLLDRQSLVPNLRREFGHIADMLDPEFAYEPDLRVDDLDAPQQGLVRDRYHVLWQMWIGARLSRADRAPREPSAKEVERFAQAFHALGSGAADLWRGVWRAQHLTHADLLDIAKNPRPHAFASPPAAR